MMKLGVLRGYKDPKYYYGGNDLGERAAVQKPSIYNRMGGSEEYVARGNDLGEREAVQKPSIGAKLGSRFMNMVSNGINAEDANLQQGKKKQLLASLFV